MFKLLKGGEALMEDKVDAREMSLSEVTDAVFEILSDYRDDIHELTRSSLRQIGKDQLKRLHAFLGDSNNCLSPETKRPPSPKKDGKSTSDYKAEMDRLIGFRFQYSVVIKPSVYEAIANYLMGKR